MMIYELRKLLERCKIEELPLWCATYSHVSTEKEIQAAPPVNMTDDCHEDIDRHPKWVFARAHIDDGKYDPGCGIQ